MGKNEESTEVDPIRVLMLCGVGFSATWLQSSITKAAEEAGFNVEVFADTYDGFGHRDLENEPFDIILIAPQIRILRKRVLKRAEPFGIKVVLMDITAFGMADGEMLFRQILEALPEKRTEE